MPMHDWTRVDAGIYHDFHNRWITHLTEALNSGILPSTYYALGEAGTVGPDLEQLSKSVPVDEGKINNTRYLRKIVIRQVTEVRENELGTGDRIVAVAEIVSASNKVSQGPNGRPGGHPNRFAATAVTDGRWQYGLEVSGTMNEDVEPRHRDKVAQLRANPYGVDGFAVTVGFPTREVIFSFHSFAEETT